MRIIPFALLSGIDPVNSHATLGCVTDRQLAQECDDNGQVALDDNVCLCKVYF
jgi:hypothetical protein